MSGDHRRGQKGRRNVLTGVSLRVVAWDDPRCVEPLRCAAAVWKERTGGCIEISRRPLTAFNDQPLRELSPQCDVMIVDYPHMAQAIEEEAVIPIGSLVETSVIQRAEERSVGAAQASFLVDGVVSGLASDAACHVSAHRPTWFEERRIDPPETWEEALALQDAVPGSVALALYHTDAISCLLSLLAASGTGPDGDRELFRDPARAVDAVALLGRLASDVEEYCWQCTPRDIFRETESRPEVAFIPLTFGYVGRTAPQQGGWRFGPPPRNCGSLLGGAGMAVSSASTVVEEAAAFATWYCSDEGQRLAARNGGQPAGLGGWEDPEANASTDNFFRRTRATQESAWVRPLAIWWPQAQLELGTALVDLLRRRVAPEQAVGELESVYSRCRRDLPRGAGR